MGICLKALDQVEKMNEWKKNGVHSLLFTILRTSYAQKKPEQSPSFMGISWAGDFLKKKDEKQKGWDKSPSLSILGLSGRRRSGRVLKHFEVADETCEDQVS